MLNQKRCVVIFSALAVVLIIALSSFVVLYKVPYSSAQPINVLSIAIAGPDKLHVNEPTTFTASTDSPHFGNLAYTWTLEYNGSKATDGIVTVTPLENGQCNLTFTQPSNEPYLLKVEVRDQDCGFGVGTKTVVDPASFPNLYLGSFGAPYSYMVCVDLSGAYYYAINGQTGQVSFTSTNASSTIISSFNVLTVGRTWQEKIYLKGNIILSTVVPIPSYTYIDLTQAYVKVANGVNHGAFKNEHLASPSISDTDITIYGGTVDCNSQNQVTDAPENGGIALQGLNMRVEDVHIKNVLSWAGISTWGWATTTTSTNTKIINNIIENVTTVAGTYGMGISVSATGSDEVTITGNQIINCQRGIYSEDYPKKQLIANNIITLPVSGSGIALYYSNGSIIQSNILTNCNIDTGASNFITVQGNTITGGIQAITITSNDSTFTANTITASAQGIYISGGLRNVFLANICSNNTAGWGIVETGGNFNNIVGCNTFGNPDGGIYTSGANSTVHISWNNGVWVP